MMSQLRTSQLCFDCIEKRDIYDSSAENIDTSLSVRARESFCPEENLNICFVPINSVTTVTSGYSWLEEDEALSESTATLLRDISWESLQDFTEVHEDNSVDIVTLHAGNCPTWKSLKNRLGTKEYLLDHFEYEAHFEYINNLHIGNIWESLKDRPEEYEECCEYIDSLRTAETRRYLLDDNIGHIEHPDSSHTDSESLKNCPEEYQYDLLQKFVSEIDANLFQLEEEYFLIELLNRKRSEDSYYPLHKTLIQLEEQHRKLQASIFKFFTYEEILHRQIYHSFRLQGSNPRPGWWWRKKREISDRLAALVSHYRQLVENLAISKFLNTVRHPRQSSYRDVNRFKVGLYRLKEPSASSTQSVLVACAA